MTALDLLLTPLEDHFAVTLAWNRDSKSKAAGNKPGPGSTAENSLDRNITGARGEVGTARALDLYVNTSVYHEEKKTGGYDLSHRVCVRSAKKRYGLLVRPDDPEDGRFVATVVRDNRVLVLGWEYGNLTKREEWLSDPGDLDAPCYLKPERLLRPLSSLLALIATERAYGIA